ncbi:MAG: FAD-binding oxidoreductase [Methylobacteriaceae bacterium]|nr:FAD-binding oxidoreductase [Methylobacteriaceae bacterium]
MSDKSPGELFDLMRDSLALWQEMVDHLGNHCEYDEKGSTVVTLQSGAAGRLKSHVRDHTANGIKAEFLTDGFASLEPELSPDVAAVGWWPQDTQVQPMRACFQIAQHLKRQGVAHRLYDSVAGLAANAAGVDIRLANGDRIAAGRVVLCTGVWTAGLLAPLGIHIPVIPRKGQLCVLERGPVAIRTKIADFAYNETVENADPSDSAVQTAAIIEGTRSGTILCGSSRCFAGFDLSLDDAVLARIMADCIRLVPSLAARRIIRGYAGLRPYSIDGLPIIASVDEHGRIFTATGHEGTGHGLAAVTGRIMAGYFGGTTHSLAVAVSPARFAS